MHQKNISTGGTEVAAAEKVLIMLHGRGATAADILSLASYLEVHGFALLAPQASNHTWYPYSFLSPPQQNEPWLSSALALLKELTDDLLEKGILSKNIYFLGFSQGACLTLEFIARNAARWGGAVAFTGGLIGDQLYAQNYHGDFGGMPVFIGTSDPDPHVPVERVQASTGVLQRLGASVTVKVYPNMGHTINNDEIANANKIFNPGN